MSIEHNRWTHLLRFAAPNCKVAISTLDGHACRVSGEGRGAHRMHAMKHADGEVCIEWTSKCDERRGFCHAGEGAGPRWRRGMS